MSLEFKHLFSPLELGPITLKNRIYVTPHATMFASDDRNNIPGETLARYCGERAKGGVGLIEVSLAMVTAGVGQVAPDSAAHFSPLTIGHPMILSGRWPIRGYDPEAPCCSWARRVAGARRGPRRRLEPFCSAPSAHCQPGS